MSLTPDQKKRIDDLLAEAAKKTRTAAGQEAPKAIRAIGDKMAASKKPFWRKLVGFFRGL